MFRMRITTVSFVVIAFLLLVPAAAFAQSGIAGSVKDTTGAVLPGVTVEVASPALIEKVRTVVTDARGEYRFVNLLTGTYSITFSLPGFNMVRRTGIALTAAFTATENAELRVGGIEESVTVSGASPVVDTHTVARQTPITAKILEELPTGRLQQGLAALVVGVVIAPNFQDVGGTKGESTVGLMIHNSRAGQMTTLYDGLPYNSLQGTGGGGSGLKINMGSTQEINLGLGNNSAEHEQSVFYNVIPKDGGNLFSGSVFVNGANRSLQSDNLTADLRARGLNEIGHVVKLWDVNPTFGGPIKKNTLWFYLGYRHWGSFLGVPGTYYNLTPKSFTYTPDYSRQGFDDTINRSATLRLTWQVAAKHKINVFYDNERRCTCHVGISTQSTSAIVSPEASGYRFYEPDYQAQATWSMPATNRLLFEAGASATIFTPGFVYPQPGVTYDIYSALEASTGLLYRAAAVYTPISRTNSYSHRSAVSYITGSHAFKVGVQTQSGWQRGGSQVNSDINIRLLNGVPNQVTQWATPYTTVQRVKLKLGLYVQDQWTIKRLTLNPGLRFDYHNAYVPASDNPATRFVPARSYAEIPNVPNWKDLSPRFGAAYDLFGNGKTALKANVNRYVIGHGTGIASRVNPVTAAVNSVTRTWTDPSGTFNPYLDCNLYNPLANGSCGQINNLNFGKPSTNLTYDPDVLNGWGVRTFNWDVSAGLQHEVRPGLSLTAGYTRMWYGNPLADGTVSERNVFGFAFPVKNLSTTPADYDPYCITAPVDPRLPGGGGYQICGLYDVKPAKFGQVQSLITFPKNYGKDWTEVYDGVDLSFAARLPARGTLSGGASTGRIHLNTCTVVNSPQDLLFCDINQPLQTQVKLNWTYPLPWDLQTSGVLQNLPGSVRSATYVTRNAEIAPSLGRNLSSGANGTVTIPLIAPETMYEPRRTQLDLRLVRNFKWGKARIQPQFDVYNVLNANSVQVMNTNYGPQWLSPTVVLPGRLVKFGVQMGF